MDRLTNPELYKKLRSGPNPRESRWPDPSEAALFMLRHLRRPLILMVDYDLNTSAETNPQASFMLGLIAALDRSAKRDAEFIRRFWYADDGAPPGFQREVMPYGDGEYVSEWVLVDWSERSEAWGIKYVLGDSFNSALMFLHESTLDYLNRQKVPISYSSLPDPILQMRADVKAAWAADALAADVFVTEREFLFETPCVRSVKSLILRPSEALPLLGLYLRQQDKFITFAKQDGRGLWTTGSTSFYVAATHRLVPAVWRWRAAFSHDETLGWLTHTLILRLGQAIKARDSVHAMLLRPQSGDAQFDVLAELDRMNLLLMAAFDNAARVVHTILGLAPKSIRHAAWQSPRWIDSVAVHVPNLASLVRNGTERHQLLTILTTFRNTIHGEMASLLTFEYAGRSRDTLVAVPRAEALTVVQAMDDLGGRLAWGIEPSLLGNSLETYIRPGVFVERMLQHATMLLNSVLDATPVERLSGVGDVPEAQTWSANPSDPFSLQSAERILWQLGISWDPPPTQ